MKTSAKIAFLTGSMFVGILVLFGITIYYFQNRYAYEDFFKRLETRVRIAGSYRFDSDRMSVSGLKSLREEYLERLEGEREMVLETDTLNLELERGVPVAFLKNLMQTGRSRFRTGNMLYAGEKRQAGSKTYLVVVSAENYYVSHHLIFLRNILLVSLFLIALVLVFLSVWLARRFFDPIHRITARVRQISSESIHLRLEHDGKKGEVSELVQTFNDLLVRIETAFETQKNFISNASHELGTPLTAIIGEAEVALLKDRSGEEYRHSVQNILAQAERLEQITRSLLFLAQTGYKGQSISFERLRVDEVIWDTIAVMEKLNPGSKIHFDTDLLPDDPFKLKIRGNRELLQMAFANLLGNACKYSANAPVQVSLASTDTSVVVIISDTGIGIPESELPFIYDPFFRATNATLYEGYGIGLPLTRNVVLLHRGNMNIRSKVNSGTVVEILFPHYSEN